MIHHSNTWRGLYASGQLGRFVVLCVGIWLHAVDTLVTATIAPAIVDDIGGVATLIGRLPSTRWAPSWREPQCPCSLSESA